MRTLHLCIGIMAVLSLVGCSGTPPKDRDSAEQLADSILGGRLTGGAEVTCPNRLARFCQGTGGELKCVCVDSYTLHELASGR